MKVVIISTQTPHHAYFVKKIQENHKNTVAFLENKKVNFPFITEHSFEKERDIFEREKWFSSSSENISQIVQTEEFKDINSTESIKKIVELRPEIIIVFGTGILRKNLLGSINCPILNLHGGDPEEYRGLDSHLWSIYHNDFNSLLVTLHHVEPELDTGDIILQDTLKLRSKMKLKELRCENTEICIKLVNHALKNYLEFGCFTQRKQRKKGRYYSAMPSELKEISLKKI